MVKGKQRRQRPGFTDEFKAEVETGHVMVTLSSWDEKMFPTYSQKLERLRAPPRST